MTCCLFMSLAFLHDRQAHTHATLLPPSLLPPSIYFEHACLSPPFGKFLARLMYSTCATLHCQYFFSLSLPLSGLSWQKKKLRRQTDRLSTNNNGDKAVSVVNDGIARGKENPCVIKNAWHANAPENKQ